MAAANIRVVESRAFNTDDLGPSLNFFWKRRMMHQKRKRIPNDKIPYVTKGTIPADTDHGVEGIVVDLKGKREEMARSNVKIDAMKPAGESAKPMAVNF